MTNTTQEELAYSLYKPPFRFHRGYIWDADSKMVCDDGDLDAVQRLRGWGYISSTIKQDADKVQDALGAIIAAALTEHWNRRTPPAEQPTPDQRRIESMRGQIKALCPELRDIGRDDLADKCIEIAGDMAYTPAEQPSAEVGISKMETTQPAAEGMKDGDCDSAEHPPGDPDWHKRQHIEWRRIAKELHDKAVALGFDSAYDALKALAASPPTPDEAAQAWNQTQAQTITIPADPSHAAHLIEAMTLAYELSPAMDLIGPMGDAYCALVRTVTQAT